MPYWYSQKEKWLQHIGAGIVLQNLQMYLKYPLLAYSQLTTSFICIETSSSHYSVNI